MLNKLIFTLASVTVFACNRTNKTTSSHLPAKPDMAIKTLTMDSLNYNDTAQLTKKFGSPIKTEIFTLEKPLNEFRIEIYNHIKAEDRHSKAVQIKELTWSFNKEKNLTVWYKLNNKKWAYLHHNLWYINASF